MNLVLASSSPRRIFYLNELGFRFHKVSPDVDERLRPGEKPRAYVRRLALEKAMEVAAKRPSKHALSPRLLERDLFDYRGSVSSTAVCYRFQAMRGSMRSKM